MQYKEIVHIFTQRQIVLFAKNDYERNSVKNVFRLIYIENDHNSRNCQINNNCSRFFLLDV